MTEYVFNDDGLNRLILGIVIQAIKDLCYDIRNNESSKSLKSFFYSEWCDWLIEIALNKPISGKDIYEQIIKKSLQPEYLAYILNGKEK